MKRTICIMSGGLDSTVLLYKAVAESSSVLALSFDYGQKHAGRELKAAEFFCDLLGVPQLVVKLSFLQDMLNNSALTNPAIVVPDGHYADDIMKITVVPNRNAIMLNIAAGYCMNLKYDRVAYAAHAGDDRVYPDCRKMFTDALDRVFQIADWHPINLWSPFVEITKADIVTIGHNFNVPFEHTYSCYKGGDIHCGTCGTCVERKEAFELANVPDLTQYLL